MPKELTVEDVDAEIARLVAAYRRGEDEPFRRAQRGAVLGRSQASLRHLIERGADLGLRDPRREATPLGWAVRERNRQAIKLLEEHAAPA